jgi:hypothetical protein
MANTQLSWEERGNRLHRKRMRGLRRKRLSPNIKYPVAAWSEAQVRGLNGEADPHFATLHAGYLLIVFIVISVFGPAVTRRRLEAIAA